VEAGAWQQAGLGAGSGQGANPCLRNDLRIPPRRTWNNKAYPYEFDVAHTVPERAQQLDLVQGVRCEIDWLLLIDNAGVKWEIQPGRGGRAKRIRWYNRPKEYQPQQFFQTTRRR
jgi:hypothetical protein